MKLIILLAFLLAFVYRAEGHMVGVCTSSPAPDTVRFYFLNYHTYAEAIDNPSGHLHLTTANGISLNFNIAAELTVTGCPSTQWGMDGQYTKDSIIGCQEAVEGPFTQQHSDSFQCYYPNNDADRNVWPMLDLTQTPSENFKANCFANTNQAHSFFWVDLQGVIAGTYQLEMTDTDYRLDPGSMAPCDMGNQEVIFENVIVQQGGSQCDYATLRTETSWSYTNEPWTGMAYPGHSLVPDCDLAYPIGDVRCENGNWVDGFSCENTVPCSLENLPSQLDNQLEGYLTLSVQNCGNAHVTEGYTCQAVCQDGYFATSLYQVHCSAGGVWSKVNDGEDCNQLPANPEPPAPVNNPTFDDPSENPLCVKVVYEYTENTNSPVVRTWKIASPNGHGLLGVNQLFNSTNPGDLEICHPDTPPQELCDTHGTIPLTITTENKVAESVTQIPDFCAFLPPPTTPTVPVTTVPGSVTDQAEEQAEEEAEEEKEKTEIWVYIVGGVTGSVACCVCFICICFCCGCWKRDEESKKLEESKDDGFVDPENKPARQSDQRYFGSDEECNNSNTKKQGVALTVGN